MPKQGRSNHQIVAKLLKKGKLTPGTKNLIEEKMRRDPKLREQYGAALAAK